MAKVQAGNQERAQARAVWNSIRTPEAWAALSATERWNIVRRVLVFMMRRTIAELPE